MNLLAQMNDLFAQEVPCFAQIMGQKPNGIWVAQTIGGGLVLLKSRDTHSIGQKVYYNALNNQIISLAPDVVFREYGV